MGASSGSARHAHDLVANPHAVVLLRVTCEELAPMGRSYQLQCIRLLLVFNSTTRSRRAWASSACGASCR